MELRVHFEHIDGTRVLREYVERRLRFSLSKFGERVGSLTVRIVDLNGPRGGVDKMCRMSASIVPTGKLQVEVTDSDLLTAIDMAADRLGRGFARKLDRFHESRTRRETVRTG